MEYVQAMNLHSPSGYAMPFEADEHTPLEITSGYGSQVNPRTGEETFNHGMDFRVRRGTWLKALATGVVTAIASDLKSGFNITINYPNYADGRKNSYELLNVWPNRMA